MSGKKQILLRLDPDVFDALKKWADDELRSVNAQIEYVLREELRARGRMKGGQDALRKRK